MKILIMCEGPNELKIINLLLDNGKLKFTRDDLLDMRPFHARQLTSPQLKPSAWRISRRDCDLSDRGQNDGLIENPQGIAFIHQIPSKILHEAGTWNVAYHCGEQSIRIWKS